MIIPSRLPRPLLILVFCLVAAPTGNASAASSSLIDMESYFRVLWGLGIVLAIMLVLYGLLRKRFSLLSTHPEKNITIVEIKPLSGKKSLCLVRVKGQEYLLGLSGDRIDHLATLPPATTFAATLEAVDKELQP